MSEKRHIVSGHHNFSASPFVVAADHPMQYELLVQMLLQHPFPDSPDMHIATSFYVTDRPVCDYTSNNWPLRWLRVGYHDGHGGVFFGDETAPEDEDWAWIALAPEPLSDPPLIYFDQDGPVAFPPEAVMPLSEVHDVVLEWTLTGQRPNSARWLTINDPIWHVDNDGHVVAGHRPRTEKRSGHRKTGAPPWGGTPPGQSR